jgi:sugar phosphate isomerase/epimerase
MLLAACRAPPAACRRRPNRRVWAGYNIDVDFGNGQTSNVPLIDMPMTISAGSMAAYSFADLVDATAATGCSAISVTKRLRHVAASREHLSVADMLSMLSDRSLHVAECEGTPHWLSDPAKQDPRVFSLDEIIDLSVALKAKGFVVYHDDRPGGSIETFTSDFALVCDRAAEHELAVAIEFLPWSRVPTFADAVTIVQGAGRPNGRIVFDTWHHGHGPNRELHMTPEQAALLHCVQVDDARPPVSDDIMVETMLGRVVPGTGTLDLAYMLGALDAAGAACPVAIESYDETVTHLDARAYAELLVGATRRLLARTAS